MSSNKYLPSKLKYDIETNPFRPVLNDGNDVVVNESFYYDDFKSALKSTQQLKIDWSQFHNHTFFMSAEVKTNLAFEQMINKFPFDGTKKEVQNFLDDLTGFEKWVFDSFPKNLGSLDFYESFIIVKDSAGSTFSDLSKDRSGDSKINPQETSPLSIEFMLTIPEGAPDQESVVCQKMSTDNMGFSVNLVEEGGISSVQFVVVSGSNYLEGNCEIDKQGRNHVCLTLERNTISSNNVESSLKIYLNEELKFSSPQSLKIGFLDISDSDFIIGSGSNVIWGSNSFTPSSTLLANLDEFRVFHTTRSPKQQKLYAEKNIFPNLDESGNNELRLYFKFNEPKGLGSESGVVLDSSGNSLHSYIQGYGDFLRKNGALKNENIILNPILFPSDINVINLNKTLLKEASQYDAYNPNLITKLIPPHYLIEGAKSEGFGNQTKGYSGNQYSGNGVPGTGILGSQQILLSFLFIWAKFFDEIKLFVDQFSNLKHVDYDDTENVPSNFLDSLFDELGINFPNFFSDSTVEQYLQGENFTNDAVRSDNPLKWIQSQLNKRVLISLPKILSSKGTQHAIKTFLRAVGIEPNNSVNIKEYGGPNRNNITNSREKRSKMGSMLKVYGNSYVSSSYLLNQRTEPGWPFISGNWENGISTQKSDGLFTSGSWFVEGNFKFNPESPINDRSLLRLMTTGSNKFVTHNLIASPPTTFSNSSRVSLSFFDNNDVKKIHVDLPDLGIFDGDVWNVSFGRLRNDDPSFENEHFEYHLRIGKQSDGDLTKYYVMSSTYSGNSPFGLITSTYNASGSYISFGKFENINQISTEFDMPLSSTFDGKISNVKFWSKGLSHAESKEHIRNFASFGTSEPQISYNFGGKISGSFERLRVDCVQKQGVVTPELTGKLEIFDFTKNFPSLSGVNFDPTQSAFLPEIFSYSQLSTTFDEDATNEKIRYRGVNKLSEADAEKSWVGTGEVHKIIDPDRVFNNNKFSVEFSLVESLNRDITNMFSTYEKFNNYLGDPNLVFSGDYPDISYISDVYFNRLDSKIDFQKFFEFYRWFDSTIGLFIDQLIPKRTLFKGTQHVIEPHMLERAKMQYYYHENYTFNQFEKKNTKLPIYESLIRKY